MILINNGILLASCIIDIYLLYTFFLYFSEKRKEIHNSIFKKYICFALIKCKCFPVKKADIIEFDLFH